ncbi:tyrosine-type recombinase/integrase [Peribacillus sp. NPDC097895]|uniref:tyrosine-type recombinase/integrase n=1 Tax=Peribacillus sp. NPDC097895 TaxID=3390619 RepID=UPI003D058797
MHDTGTSISLSPDIGLNTPPFRLFKERDFAILSLFLESGIRVNELFNLRLRDLYLEEKQIHVLRKVGKKDVVAVSPPSMQDIKDYLAVRWERYRGSNDYTTYVFLTRVNDCAIPLSNRAIEALVKKYTKAFKSNKSMSPHKLRHTYGTNLMEQSGDIHLLMTKLVVILQSQRLSSIQILNKRRLKRLRNCWERQE